MNHLLSLVWFPNRDGSDTPEVELFRKYAGRSMAKYAITASEVINKKTYLLRQQLSHVIYSNSRIIVVTVDPTKVATWGSDVDKVLNRVASFDGQDSDGGHQAFAYHSNEVASAYLVPLKLMPESIQQFITCNKCDINEYMRENVEKDLREAIEDGFPRLPKRPKLTPDEVDARIGLAEQRFAELRRLQIEELKDVLSDLAGTSKGTYEGNKADAARVMKLVESAKAVLLFTGEGRKGKTYTSQPCTIRCSDKDTIAFQLRTADRAAKYLGSVDFWPSFAVVLRDENQNTRTVTTDLSES